jgi:hypothetical protein
MYAKGLGVTQDDATAGEGVPQDYVLAHNVVQLGGGGRGRRCGDKSG